MKKLVKIKVPKFALRSIEIGQLVNECQSIIRAKKETTSSHLAITCLSHHLPNALTEIITYIHKYHDEERVVTDGIIDTSNIKSDQILGKVQVDKAAWIKFANNANFRKSLRDFKAWPSSDKDDSIIFQCSTGSYDQALADITRLLLKACEATFVRPMKLRKHRLPLEDRKDLQSMYARTPHRVSQIASIFRLSPTSADAFCIKDASYHPELFLTNEEVDSYNSILKKGKLSTRQ